jgi:sphingomyelin phosphodiesterase acid-like 3
VALSRSRKKEASMSKPSRYGLLLVLLSICLSPGCGTGTNPTSNTFTVVVFSDIHFNPFYDPSLCPRLVLADASGWASIFKTSSLTAPSAWGSDTNYPLLVLALASIRENVGASPLIFYTGDLLGHNFAKLFFQYCGSNDVAAMQAFADKTVAFVMQQVRSSVGNLPVMFAVGNSDSYTGLGPDSTFLSNTADLFYADFLNGSVDRQAFLDTFTRDGYYSAEPMGTNLMVIGLNTNPFAPQSSDHSAVEAELSWLDSTLASAQAGGKKVWLLMHIPPGADTVATATTPQAFDNNGQLITAAMMWVQDDQASFLHVLSNYPGLITLTLAAHTHKDEFRIMSPDDVLDITPSISPWFGNDPAFKVFTFTQDTFTPTNYRSLNYDLATMPRQFKDYYTFSQAYSMQGPLDSSLVQLYSELVSNNAKRALYIGQYNSGNNSLEPGATTSWNPITNANWPIFACGIGKMARTDFIECVNSY